VFIYYTGAQDEVPMPQQFFKSKAQKTFYPEAEPSTAYYYGAIYCILLLTSSVGNPDPGGIRTFLLTPDPDPTPLNILIA
jgi:hypothetical protein